MLPRVWNPIYSNSYVHLKNNWHTRGLVGLVGGERRVCGAEAGRVGRAGATGLVDPGRGAGRGQAEIKSGQRAQPGSNPGPAGNPGPGWPDLMAGPVPT